MNKRQTNSYLSEQHWKCKGCGEVFGSCSAAERCCGKEIESGYLCICYAFYHKAQDLEKCLKEDRKFFNEQNAKRNEQTTNK